MRKGFAVSGIIYTLLVIFLIITISFLVTVQNRKSTLDKLKQDTIGSIYCNQNIISSLEQKIEELKEQIENKKTQIDSLKDIGDAEEADILSGKIAYVKGKKVVGTMINVNGSISSKAVEDTGSEVRLQIKTNGYYDQNDSLTTSLADFRKAIGLTADKIKEGETILGITGTYKKSYPATYTVVSNRTYECCTQTNCGEKCSCTKGWECDMSPGYCMGYCIDGLQTCSYSCDSSCSTCTEPVYGYKCPNGGTLSGTTCYY